MSSTTPPGRALADAAARGLEVTLHVRRSHEDGDGDDVVVGSDVAGGSGAGIPAAPLRVKTIVLQRREGFVFVLVPLAERFSWPKLRAALGVNRVRLPTAEEAYRVTGYHRGTITLLGAATAFPVLADRRILGHDIALGSGSPEHAIGVNADELVRAYDATVLDLTLPPE